MIGRFPHPTEPGNARAVALYVTRPQVWESLSGLHSDELSAARACAGSETSSSDAQIKEPVKKRRKGRKKRKKRDRRSSAKTGGSA